MPAQPAWRASTARIGDAVATAVLTPRPPSRPRRRRRAGARISRRAAHQPCASTITSALTNSTTRPWMMNVRLVASSGSKIVGSRLRCDVPAQQRAEQQRRDGRAAGGVAPEQRDGDPEEADLRDLDVVGGDPELPAEHVQRARQPGEGAAHRHHEDVVAADVDAAVARRLGIEADRAHLVAGRGAVEDDPEHEHRREGDEDPDVQALQLGIAPEDVQLGARDDVVGHRHRLLRGIGVLQRPAGARTGRCRPRSRSS